MRFLALLFFVTLPLYMIEEFRLQAGGLTITLHLVVTAALAVAGFSAAPRVFLRYDPVLRWLGVPLMLLLVVHLVGLMYAGDKVVAFGYLAKLVFAIMLGLISYLLVRNYPHLQRNVHRYGQYFVWASGALLSFYLVQNLLIYKNAYFSLQYVEGIAEGRNQAQVYLALSLPWAFYYFSTRSGWLNSISLLVHLVSVVYLSSRGLWVTLLATMGIMMLFNLRIPVQVSRRFASLQVRNVLIIGWLLMTGGLTLALNAQSLQAFIVKYAEYTDARVSKAVDGASGQQGDGSTSERLYYIQFGLEQFVRNPVAGDGLGDFQRANKYGKLSHNDYIFMLADMGGLGLFTYLCFVGAAILIMIRKRIPVYLLLPFWIDLMFINAYTFPLFWAMLGIILASAPQTLPMQLPAQPQLKSSTANA